MSFFKLTLKPGIDKQNTEYGAEGGWTDGDMVRFRYGLPEKIGGWEAFDGIQDPIYLLGLISDIHTWNALNGDPYMIVGTNRKLYITNSGLWTDITPIRATSAAGAVTFAATSGSTTITVTHTSHGAIEGDFVTYSGAATLGGVITDTILNAEYEITQYIDANTYEITAPVAANASDSGNGGASVVGEYQINVGGDTSYFSYGWGVGTWGLGSWGTPRPASAATALYSRNWVFDSFGEDVVCQLVNGAIYYWDTSAGITGNRATAISGAPTKSAFALVSTPDRHLVCLGTETTVGTSSTQDPMFVRFSNQEDVNTFTETATNTAGGQRLTDGSRIVSAVRSRGQILIWTDTSLHGMQYIGPPYTFGFSQLGANCGCVGPHAAVDVNGLAFWMGTDSFYLFDGTVKKVPCTVHDYVFDDFNKVQADKVRCGINSQYNEVTWYYPSFTSDYIDRCVTFNYVENCWSIGTLARTAWEDIGTYTNPLGAEYLPTSTETYEVSDIYGITAGRSIVYRHETGTDAHGASIDSFIYSGYFDIGDGDNMLLMRRFIPDFKEQVGNLTVYLYLRPYPQATASPSSLSPHTITPTTQKVDTRARGRQIALRIESDELGGNWRYGTLRVDIQPDGLR
jgi:hypothetical protein